MSPGEITTVPALARELGAADENVRNWIKQLLNSGLDALRCLARAIGATNTTPVPAGAELFPKVNEPIELFWRV
jgi:transposase-like protein